MAAPRHALLLAAGLGTRLMPLTTVRAKPAVPVAGEPLVRRIVGGLVRSGYRDIVCNLHHLPHTVARVLGDGGDLGARIRYSWEGPQVLGSAGGPRLAFELTGAPSLLVVNGDTLTDVNVNTVVESHVGSGALVTMALVPNREPLRYGGVLLDAAGRVVGFVPRGAAAPGSFHFIGVQIVEAEALRELRAGAPAPSIGGIYDRLLATAGIGSIRGIVSNASFLDVGTIADYLSTSAALSRQDGDGTCPVGARSSIDSTARCIGSIVWDDVKIGAGAELEECIVTDGVTVPAGARYQRTTLIAQDGTLAATPFELPG
jgi:NDP-sugar pyrophosphorylase family protein